FDLNNRPAAERDGYRPPVKLAVLLPLSGQLATAAAPVRDGLLAGYYGESRRRPEINFYDTAGTPGGAIDAYGKAAAAGADFIVGPLGRDEVSAVFRESNLSVPVLALNRGAVAPPPGNAGFSLAPEDDGIIAAEYLLSRERRTALVINGNDDNGKRAANAFRERFSERGGTVVEAISVADAPGSISANLATASQRGVDAVFLALKGGAARAIAPQLAMAGLGGKSRVATSQLISGTGKPEQDSALDGIVYPTEVWTARGIGGLPAAGSVGAGLPTARGPAARLFAFGYDAWMLTAYLEKLATGTNAEVKGATGVLKLDGFGNVIRTPAWSTFNGGRAAPINGGD
ncbi:MAG: penicillin-binding protein activator, partial [Pseudoxanthomonas sp.]